MTSRSTPPDLIDTAKRYTELGPARFRRSDSLGRPRVGIPRWLLAQVRSVFRQIETAAAHDATRRSRASRPRRCTRR